MSPPALSTLVDFGRFETYCHALVRSRDVDPVYVFVPNILRHEGFEPAWFLFVYCAFYSLDSAVRVCRVIPEARKFTAGGFALGCSNIRKFGTERRGSNRRMGSLIQAFEAFCARRLEIDAAARTRNCHAFRNVIKQLPWQSHWAAFKLCELMEKVAGHPNLAPLSMEVATRDVNSSVGPQGGCRTLYSRRERTDYPQAIAAEWEDLGVRLTQHLGYGLGEVETCLCKWSKVVKGQYFIGHDIYEFTHLKHARLWDGATYARLMRASGFDPALWDGTLDVKRAKRLYADRRILLNAHFAQKEWP